MHEYTTENNHDINVAPLKTGHVALQDYRAAHQGTVIACHDVLVKLGDKYLLIQRDNVPAKGHLWPLGGRLQRGVPATDSLRGRVQQESGLQLTDITFLGVARTLFATDPFGHGKGTDTLNLLYAAKGEGTLQLDALHTSPTLFTRQQYQNELRAQLHPYVVELLDTAFARGF